MEGVLGFLYIIGTFLVLLTILVFVHEMGHYLAARTFGVKVEVFSIGFGKELFGWNDKKGTRWKISLLPLGGYVKFLGDGSAISNPAKYLKRIAPEDRDRCFHFKPLWQRAIVVAAGPVINLAMAVAIFTGVNLFIGQYAVIEPVIQEITEGLPADEAGLLPGDRILEANGKEIESFDTFGFLVQNSPGREMEITVQRGGEVFDLTLTPMAVSETDKFGNTLRYGRIGVQASVQELRDYTLWTATRDGFSKVGLFIGGIIDFLGRAFSGQASLDEVGGPVKIAQYSSQAAEGGFLSYIYFMGAISVALGFINLLPIPLLDGGHLMFYSIEAVKGRPVSVKAQELASMIGLAFVFGWFLLITWNDLRLPGLG